MESKHFLFPNEFLEEDKNRQQEPKATTSWSLATGIYYRRVMGQNLSLKLYADMNWSDMDLTETYLDYVEDGEPVYEPSTTSTIQMDSFSIGASLVLNIW